MGGTIKVRSGLGEGTTFNIHLEFDSVPIDPDMPAAAGDHDADDTALSGRHILLCEDHALNQEIAKALLDAKQMTVVTAENGYVGLEEFRRSAPRYFSAVLMDIRMPVMDGYEATKRIREMDRPDARTVPIIAMTADALADDVRKCLDLGMNGHISKPIDPEKLYSILAEKIK